MRKLTILLALFSFFTFAGTSFADPPPAPTYDNAFKLRNTGVSWDATVRVIKLVRNSSQDPNTGIISAGSVVVYDTVSDDGVSVRMTTTSGDGAIAGIAATLIETSDNVNTTSAGNDEGRKNWGWSVVHGKADATAIAGGTNEAVVGDLFITSRDAGAIASLEVRRGVLGMTQLGSAQTLDASSIRFEINRGGASGGFFLDAGTGTATSYEVMVENT